MMTPGASNRASNQAPALTIAEKFVDAGGIRTRYLECGSGEAVILVHGGHFGNLGSADDWEPVMPVLAQNWRVLAIDKIGNGWSDNPRRDEDYVIGSTVRQLVDFMDALGLDKAHLMGHSRGGYTIVRTALDHPQRVHSLCVVSSATLMTAPNNVYAKWDEESLAIADARERWRYRLRCNSWSDAHIDEAYIDRNLAIDALPSHQEASRKMGSRRMEPHLLWPRFRADLLEQQKWMHERITRDGLSLPVLIVWGFDDPSARLEPTGLDTMRLLMPAAPNSEFHVIKNAGHYVYREQPAAFGAVVSAFLARQK